MNYKVLTNTIKIKQVMSKKIVLIAIAGLFTVNVWGQNFIQTTSTNLGAIDLIHDGSLTIPHLAVTNSLKQYSLQSGFTQRRLTFNTNEGDKAYLYYYDPTATTYHTINIGGYRSLSSGLTVLSNGNVGIAYSNPLVNFHIGNGTNIDGSLVSAIFGNAYNHWTNFGGVTGGRIRGSNEGYIIIDGNPNGSGNNNVYLNSGTPSDVIIAKGGGNVAIGTSTIPSGYKLAVDGKVICEEVKVEMSDQWADFVFESTYNLMPLKELDTYIKENKHLPEIPTTTEVKENGISVGEMNAKLLQKIEELTLHTIQQQELIEALLNRVEQIENNN